MVEHFSISNGVVQFVDRQAGTTKKVTDLNLSLAEISLDRPIKMMLKMRLDGMPLSVEGMVGPLGNPVGSKEMDVDFKIKALDLVNCALKGRLVDPTGAFTFSGKVDLAAFSPRKLAAALKIDFPVETSDPSVLEKVAFVGEFAITANTISLNKTRFELDESTVTLDGRIAEFQKPAIQAKIHLDTIDLDRYLPPVSEKNSEVGAVSAPASASEFKVAKDSVLRTMALNAQITTGMVKIAHVVIDATKLIVVGKSGVFTVEPATVDLYEGKIMAKARADLAAFPVRSRVEVDVSKVQVEKLLQDAAKINKLEGMVQSHIVLSARGTSVDAILRSAEGNGNLLFNDGAIVGIDLAAMARNTTAFLQGKQQTTEKARTDFSELSIPFSLSKGVATFTDARMKSPFIRLLANGTTNLVTQSLDVVVEPKLVGTIKGQGDRDDRSGLAVPVRITGTFADPKIRPEVTKSLQKALSDPAQLQKDAKSMEKKIKGLKGMF